MTTSKHALLLLLPLSSLGCAGRECYVGVRGTEATITVKGMFPGGTCDALVQNPTRYLGDIAEDTRKDLYARSERPTEAMICEYRIDGKQFIVRDAGLLKVVGNILCSSLSRRAD